MIDVDEYSIAYDTEDPLLERGGVATGAGTAIGIGNSGGTSTGASTGIDWYE